MLIAPSTLIASRTEVLDTACMRRSSKKFPTDPNQLAAEIVRMSTEVLTPHVGGPALDPSISQYLSKIGKKGGWKGGKARAAKLSAKKRSEIAKKAAKTR